MVDVETLTRRHGARQRRLASAAAASAGRAWRRLDPADLTRSWRGRVGPAVVATTAVGQLAAAEAAAAYLDQFGEAPPGGLSVNADALAGVTPQGTPISAPLYSPVVGVKQRIAAGEPLAEAMRREQARLLVVVATMVADAGRYAAGIAVTARGLAGYERVVTPPACARCVVLAGRLYRWSRGFQRHPRCDCTMRPVTAEQWRRRDPADTPRELFDRMGEADQDRVFGRAGARAIRDGADLAQVVNARRGMSEPGAAATVEGTTRRGVAGARLAGATRLTPEGIYAQAADRGEAIDLLRRNGYLT